MSFYTFANATTSIPLTNLDANFATPITLGKTAVTINGTFSSIGNLTLNNATIASGNSTVTKETVTTITSPAATNLTIQSAGTTAMTIDTSQNVAIGTGSPLSQSKLTVSQDGTVTAGGLTVDQTNGSSNRGGGVFLSRQGDNRASIESDYFNGLIFSNKSGTGALTEKMRIDTSGNLLVGTTSVGAGAIVDVQSTTKGVRFPNMTTTQKTAITPAAGTVVFDTTLAKLCVYSGSAWQTITSV